MVFLYCTVRYMSNIKTANLPSNSFCPLADEVRICFQASQIETDPDSRSRAKQIQDQTGRTWRFYLFNVTLCITGPIAKILCVSDIMDFLSSLGQFWLADHWPQHDGDSDHKWRYAWLRVSLRRYFGKV